VLSPNQLTIVLFLNRTLTAVDEVTDEWTKDHSASYKDANEWTRRNDDSHELYLILTEHLYHIMHFSCFMRC
jgi:hypothetical protein